MFHSKLLALLQGVKDHPDDDGPRLVLADWLDENGSDEAERARADFIRLQCQLARLKASDPARPKVQLREQTLRREFAGVWSGDWPNRVSKMNDADEGCWFARGLLRLQLTRLRWLSDDPPDQIAWAWVDGLTMRGIGPDEVREFAANPLLAQLNHLSYAPMNFWGTHEGPEIALALAASPHLARLDSLALSLVSVRPQGARALAASPYLTRLTSLVLWATAIDPEGAVALAQSPYLRRLKSLDLSSYDCTPANEIGNEGAKALAGSANLTNLSRLELMENSISDVGVRSLAESANLRGLTHLNLSGNSIGLDGMRALATSPHLGRLTSLMVGGYGFIDGYPADLLEAAEILLSSACLPNLKHLDLGYPNYEEPNAETKEAFRERFGDRVVWGDGQTGLAGLDD